MLPGERGNDLMKEVTEAGLKGCVGADQADREERKAFPQERTNNMTFVRKMSLVGNGWCERCRDW